MKKNTEKCKEASKQAYRKSSEKKKEASKKVFTDVFNSNKYLKRHMLLIIVLGGMAIFIPVFGIEKIPRYPVFHGILAVN